MRLNARALIATSILALALAVPGGASAALKTLVFQSSPIAMDSYGVSRGQQRVASPAVDGFVVGMSADIVDESGNAVPDEAVMLHHVVFLRVLHPDLTCSTFTDYEGNVSPFPAERFYAEGEEHLKLDLPGGYGYATTGNDIWGLVYMLMNHQKQPRTVRVRYTVQYVTDEALRPVRPVWLDVRNCQADPIFSVPGTGGPRSQFVQSSSFRMPETGRLVAGGGHLHGGGMLLSLSVEGSQCVSEPAFRSLPTWGGIEPKPEMHEPGPTNMTAFSSATGIPVLAGQTLRLDATYDNSFPHVRVMGILILYFAPDPVTCAGPRPPHGDIFLPTPPHTRLPLLRTPRGPLARNIRSTWVGDYRFGNERVQIRRGTTFTWRFIGQVEHDVTLATGPVGFASPSRRKGTFSFRFGRPGTYKLFCSLHPTRMTQIVTVRR